MSLKKQYISSSFWVVLGRGSSNAMSFVVFAVIARYLGPVDFGLVAFAAIFTDLTRALALSGIPQALIRGTQWEQSVASTAFWLNLLFALALAVVLACVVGPALAWFHGLEIWTVVAVLSLTFVIESSSSVHEAKLQREFGYKSLANRLLIGTLAGGIVGVAMAITGFGVWALVGSRLANSIVQAGVLWATVHWRPSAHFSKAEAKPLIAYASHLGSSAIIGKLNNKIPELVLGFGSSIAAVGLYRVGSRAVSMIQDAVVSPLQSTTLSAFSRAHEKEALAGVYNRIVQTCGLVAFPVYFGAAAIAPDFTILVFGKTWALSGQVMAALAVGGAASALLSFTQPALVALSLTRYVVLNNLATFVIAIVMSLALAQWGAVAVALGFALRAYLSIPLSLMFMRRAGGFKARTVLAGLWPSFLAATMMAVSIWALGNTLLATLSPIVRMIVMVAVGMITYPLLLLVVGRRLLKEAYAEAGPLIAGLRKKSGKR